MATTVNRTNPDRWNDDTALSVSFYNNWFLKFAPATYIEARRKAKEDVDDMLHITKNLSCITSDVILQNPKIVATLRLCTAPPVARDRLAGLIGETNNSFIKNLENASVPVKKKASVVRKNILDIIDVLKKLFDVELFPWIKEGRSPKSKELLLTRGVIVDRFCGSLSDPIIRNAQEKRQLQTIEKYLKELGYNEVKPNEIHNVNEMRKGTFAFHYNVPTHKNDGKDVNVTVDVIVKRKGSNRLPLLIECKSAGDYTNTNKRRKEESDKMAGLKRTYGNDVDYVLFLCGYFNSAYLGYEAAEQIDWVWEHRIDDMKKLGL